MPEKSLQNRRLRDARVGSYGQTLGAHLDQLRTAGCHPVYREKVTGARPDRRERLKLLKVRGRDDVVTMTRVDRLECPTSDKVPSSSMDAKAQFRSLGEPWADTGTSIGQLMSAVLDELAHVERDLIRTAPHRRGQEPCEGARPAHGPAPKAHTAAAEGSTATAAAGRNAQGTGEKLHRRQIDDYETRKPSAATLATRTQRWTSTTVGNDERLLSRRAPDTIILQHSLQIGIVLGQLRKLCFGENTMSSFRDHWAIFADSFSDGFG